MSASTQHPDGPQYPRGKVNGDDEGQIEMRLAADPEKGVVVMAFPSPVTWLGIPADAAIHLARGLIQHAMRAGYPVPVSLEIGATTPASPVVDDAVLHALERAVQLFDQALPKFDWGKSPLDANAIRLLNEVPAEVRATLRQLAGGR